MLKSYIQNSYAINTDKITHQRFKELENDVSLLKSQVANISKGFENSLIQPKHGIFYDGQIYDAYAHDRFLIIDQPTQFLLYKAENLKIKVDVLVQDETVWLSQEQMAEIF